MNRRSAFLVLLTAIMLQMPWANAHHSFTGYDPARVTLNGVVKAFEWTNPHVWIRVTVVDASGQQAEWGVETAAVAVAKRMGFSNHALMVGDKVQVVVHPRADGAKIGSFLQITLPDGKVIKGRDEFAIKREDERVTDGLPPLKEKE